MIVSKRWGKKKRVQPPFCLITVFCNSQKAMKAGMDGGHRDLASEWAAGGQYRAGSLHSTIKINIHNPTVYKYCKLPEAKKGEVNDLMVFFFFFPFSPSLFVFNYCQNYFPFSFFQYPQTILSNNTVETLILSNELKIKTFIIQQIL